MRKFNLGSWMFLIYLLLSLFPGQAGAQGLKPGPVGIVCLIPQHNAQYPLAQMPSLECWTNPQVQGVLVRLDWGAVEPAEGQFDFTVCDQAIALAHKYGKFVGLGVCAGKKSPDWVYSAGAQKFYFHKQHKGGMKAAMAMPLPWDPVFQQKWGTLIKALGRRYDPVPEVAYIAMSGPGRDFETFFVDSPSDIQQFDQSGGPHLWAQAFETIAGLYAQALPHTSIIYALGPPTPTPEGRTVLVSSVNDLLKKYSHQFGVCANSLAPNYSPHESGGIIRDSSSDHPVGFQMLLPSKGGETMQGGALADALQIGVSYKAHYIEVYRPDCDDTAQQGALLAANSGLLTNARGATMVQQKGN